MEKNFYNDEFEQLLKEKSDSFRMYPSKRVWHSIYNDLHPGRKWPSIAMGLSLIIALIFIGYINNNQTSSKDLSSKTASNTQSSITALQNNSSGINNDLGINNQGFTSGDHQDGNSQNITGIAASTRHTKGAFDDLISIFHQPAVNGNFAGSATSADFDPYVVALINKRNSNNSRRMHTPGRFVTHTESSSAVDDGIAARTARATTNNDDSNGDDIASSGRTLKKNDNSKLSSEAVTAPDNDNSDKNSIITGIAVPATEEVTKKPIDKAGQNARLLSGGADKAWIENYAFYNKKSSKSKWKGRMDVEFYATPNIGYRKLTGGAVYDANPLTALTVVRGDVGNTVDHTPALGLETGAAFAYSLTKKVQIKAGLQFNYTSYAINAGTTYHPVLTSLLLVDPASGQEYTSSRISTLANNDGAAQPVKVFNTTYQISLPVGFAVKIAGNKKVDWYGGASVQPTYVFGGQANLLSSDRRNYISESSMIHNWNFNTGAETYLSYKFNGYSLQVGPQFRYQLMSTYDKKYVNSERLYNAGIKVGIVKKL